MKGFNIKPIFHHYEKWEDYKNGMWRRCGKQEEKELLQKAILFTGDYSGYGSYMIKVLSEYPISCEQFLSKKNVNRRAWIGHAACCIAFSCPEYITRLAWGKLTEDQRIKANLEADKAILAWELSQSFVYQLEFQCLTA